MSLLDEVLNDVAAESMQLDTWVSGLDAAGWASVTTPEGWTVAHQIGHLHWTDDMSVKAATDPESFSAEAAEAMAAGRFNIVDEMAAEYATLPPMDLLEAWRAGRGALVHALRAVPEGTKVPWFGPPMSPVSMATARMMETWAHAFDVADAIGVRVAPSDRVKHVCHLGVRTRGFAYLVRGESDPGVEIRVELTAPSGDVWAWGPEDATERVRGSAWDFALLATRRRARVDVHVQAEGAHADHWLDIVQAFAGAPGADPLPLAQR